MREMVFGFTPDDLGIEVKDGEVFGAIMELGASGTVVTIVALSDGAVSCYVRDGASTIGAGTHEPVRAAAKVFLEAIVANLSRFSPVKTTNLPKPNEICFYAKTPGKILGAAMLSTDGANHPLRGLFNAGQGVLTQIRLASQGAQSAGPSRSHN
jgi:hypothetical protein